MPWQSERTLMQLARQAFPAHAPRVLSSGDQYLLSPTPYGRLLLIRQGRRCLVAAERPPSGPPGATTQDLPPSVTRHLRAHRLQLWKVVEAESPAEVIFALGAPDSGGARTPDPGAPADLPLTGGGQGWSRLLVRLKPERRLVGSERLRASDQALAVLESRRPGGPVPQLTGPAGIGKRTAAAELAARLDLRVVELPLGRLVGFSRVFQTPVEAAVEALLGLQQELGPDCLVVLTEASMLVRLDHDPCALLLREARRLQRVLLTSVSGGQPLPGGVSVALPGLESQDEARALLLRECPAVRLEPAAWPLLLRAATAEGLGLVPGRLVDVVRLASRLGPPRAFGTTACLRPDDLAGALALMQASWGQPPLEEE